LPETVPLYSDMRVDDYLLFIGHARGLKGKALEKRFQWLRESCGITSVWKHGIHELSKGYRQRVGLAQALIHDPKILILDEPTTGLDPLQIIGIRKLIKDLAKKKTIIFSTHILQEAASVADRIVIINEGRIIAQGTQEELAENANKYRCYVLSVKTTRTEMERALKGLREAADIDFIDETEDGYVTFEISSSFTNEKIGQEIAQMIQGRQMLVRTLVEKNFDLEGMFISLLTKDRQESVLAEEEE